MMSGTGGVQSGLATGSEGLVCFVCDVGVVGRYYSLATCRTQATNIRLIEKLGQLVGDNYMVVISEDDVICRGCATMINSLDRLEKEVGSLRSIVLRYLESKYNMEDGELVNARAKLPPYTKPTKETKTPSSPTDFHSLKRKAMSAEIENEDGPGRESNGKENVWLQCDRCKYTTHYNAFMVHHVKSHDGSGGEGGGGGGGGTPAAASGAEGGGEGSGNLSTIAEEEGTKTEEERNGEGETEMEGVEPGKKEIPETVEMIAAEIGEGEGEGEEAVVTGEEGVLLGGPEVQGKQVTLQAVEGEDGNNTICMVDENGMIVQKVEQAEDGTLYVQMTDNTDPTKQVLSVGEDGSVQMVEVLWDDMVPPDDSDNHSLVTF